MTIPRSWKRQFKTRRSPDAEAVSLATAIPAEAEGWEAEAATYLEDRNLRRWRGDEAPVLGYDTRPRKVKAPDIQLTSEVKAYLERRNKGARRKETQEAFPPIAAQTHDETISFETIEARVEPSRRDVLMELFVCRKISSGQLHAGRRWQADKEWATLQPSQSIDWSQSTNRMPYQARGEVTEGQWIAMKRRRQFTEAIGLASSAFLDFCLDADKGSAELSRLLNVTSDHLACVIDDLLSQLCTCFGDRTYRYQHQALERDNAKEERSRRYAMVGKRYGGPSRELLFGGRNGTPDVGVPSQTRARSG